MMLFQRKMQKVLLFLVVCVQLSGALCLSCQMKPYYSFHMSSFLRLYQKNGWITNENWLGVKTAVTNFMRLTRLCRLSANLPIVVDGMTRK